MLKIINSKLSIEIPKKQKMIIKFNPEMSSTRKYLKSILVEQCRHFAIKTIKETNGILSNQLICFWHDKQQDLPLVTLIFSGNL